jgi:3-methyladenine DNA glycosylase AlkD
MAATRSTKRSRKPASRRAATPAARTPAKRAPPARAAKESAGDVAAQAAAALAWLERKGRRATRDGYARYGIVAPRAFGVAMRDVQALAKELGRSHELALALWASGWYEARLLCSYVDEPAAVTPAQMDRWCRDFDNWGICDTVCFCLFDRTPHAWAKVEEWSRSDEEFVKRAAFALLASLAGHDKRATDAQFLATLPAIERAAADERNFVKKGVSWALRRIGRRNPALYAAALKSARRLADSRNAASSWVGRDTLRELQSPAIARKLAPAPRSAAYLGKR